MDNLKPIFLMLFILFAIIITGYLYNKYNTYETNEASRINNEYPLIDDYKDSIALCGIIIHGDFGYSAVKGYFVDLSNGKKFALMGSTRNKSYSPYILVDFLQYKDSIYYNPRVNGDTIFIFRGGKKYFFRLGKTLDINGKVIYPLKDAD